MGVKGGNGAQDAVPRGGGAMRSARVQELGWIVASRDHEGDDDGGLVENLRPAAIDHGR